MDQQSSISEGKYYWRWKKWILLPLFFLSFLTAHSQTLRQFSADTATFPEALRTFMGVNLNEQDMATLDRFTAAYRNGTFSDNDKATIIETCNQLRLRKARNVPHVSTYLEDLLVLKEKKVASSDYLAWEEALTDLISVRQSTLATILRFLRNTRDFLTDYTLYSTAAVTWKIDSTNFSFAFDKQFSIHIDPTTLTGYAQRDSIMILRTHGDYFPVTQTWQGKEGHVTWERAGYPAADVWADLPHYSINLTKSQYQADSVTFMNTTYFKEPVLGTFTDKIQKIIKPEQASYPVFDSYEKIFSVENIQQGINYIGGLSMAGAVVKGTGSEYSPATLSFYRSDTLQLVIRSQSITFRKSRFSSDNCQMTFMLDKDSIYHPNIAFIYNYASREVSFYQNDNLLTHAPFYDSYHQINATVKSFSWKMDEPVAILSRLRGTTIGEADFWSSNFFNARHFYSMQGMDEENPLQTVKRFVEWYYRDEFPVEDFAKWMGRPEFTARRMLVNLALEGFIYYNPETGEAKVKQDLYNYLEAFTGHIDYDVIRFNSSTKAPVDNAILNLKNQELQINGVPTIFLSDSQYVAIYPDGNRIRMSKNRSFSFNGIIRAGLTTFYGKNFFFNYDSFNIEMHKIDSMRLFAYGDQRDDLGRPIPEKIQNMVEIITGALYVDKPDNKAGLKHYAAYPYFRSTEDSYVYYEETSVYDSVYAKDQFRFVLHPFVLSNLDGLTKQELEFNGDFTSGGIFPPIPQKLLVQDDNSLGFITETPPEGYPVYDGKGRFYDKVKMSNHGLEGKGKLTHLTASFSSDKYIFFPDSMIATAHDFQITPQHTAPMYPEVTGTDADLKWEPKEDKFNILKRSTPFKVFGSRSSLSGNLELTPDGVFAEGTFVIADARLWSTRFALTDKMLTADTANFTIVKEAQGEDRLIANQVGARVNMEQGYGSFASLVDTTHLIFPENQYISSLDRITWDLNAQTLRLANTAKQDDPFLFNNDPEAVIGRWQQTPTFISTNPKTDTLGFSADSALYEIASHELTTYDVPFLEIADALIYPDKNVVGIDKTGNIHRLTHARLVAGQHHTLDSVSVDIFSRKNFFGSGQYTYTMNNGKAEQIFFEEVKVDDSTHTYAATDIPDEQHFMLSPAFEYRGKVELYATKEHLTFSGGARILHDCNTLSRSFLKFTAEIDPEDVRIPVNGQALTDEGVRIYRGHFISIDSTHVYSAFLSRRKNYADIPISSADGFLIFDAPSGEYRIGSQEKLADTTTAGNYLALNRNYCTLYGEGQLDLGIRLGQLKIVTAGKITQQLENDTATLQVAMGLDFLLHPEALTLMSSKIDSLTHLKPVDIRDPYYQKKLRMLLPEDAVKKMTEEANIFGPAAKLPPEIIHTIFLTNVTLKWNQATNSYISQGRIGVGNVNGKLLNVYADGYLEIQKKRSGDMLDLYLKFDDQTWYYFGYTRGVMQVLSSDESMLDTFRDLPPNKRRVKVDRRGTPYTYMIGVDVKLSRFLQKMRTLNEPPTVAPDAR